MIDPDAIPEMDVFVCRIRLGNAEMQTREDIARCLTEVQELLRSGWDGKLIRDINGNTVGSFQIHYHANV
jgi:hypothetical protein